MSAKEPWNTSVACIRRISSGRDSREIEDLQHLVRTCLGCFWVWGLKQRDRVAVRPRLEVVSEERDMMSRNHLVQEAPMISP